jgi:hypothetical protein
METTCPDCGSQNYDFARYCRKCGRQLTSAEFNEAPTRGLDHQRPQATFGTGEEQWQGGPRYVPPPGSVPVFQGGPYPPGVVPPQHQQPPVPQKKGSNLPIIIGSFLLVALFIVVAGVVIVVKQVNRAIEAGPQVAPVIVEGTGDDNSVIDPDTLPADMQTWIYPGSTVRQAISGGIGGVKGVYIKMSTEDDLNEIVEHYQEILTGADTNLVRQPDQTIIASPNGQSVIIKPGADGTNDIEVALGSGFPGAGAPTPPPPRGAIPKPPAEPVPAAPPAAPPATPAPK